MEVLPPSLPAADGRAWLWRSLWPQRANHPTDDRPHNGSSGSVRHDADDAVTGANGAATITSYGSPDHATGYRSEGSANWPAFKELFAVCEGAFGSLEPRPVDLRGALAVYRTLEDQAKTFVAGDARRSLLLEWLDSLQGDSPSP